MATAPGRTALIVAGSSGQPTVEELRRRALADERPRKDYVVLSELLDADVIDSHWMAAQGHPAARALCRAEMALGQVTEVFLHQARYAHLLAWSDRLGVLLAALFKVTGGRDDLVMVSTWATRGRKAVFFQRLKVWTHLRLIFARSLQAELMRDQLGVPAGKLRVEPRGVDERFWRPMPDVPEENLLCSVGWEARDYRTLIDAMRGSPLQGEFAVGAIAKPLLGDTRGPVAATLREIAGEGLPDNVKLTQRDPRGLRQLYARSKMVVIAVKDVEFDAGVTATTEAMAMGKPVIASRTPGIADLFNDGEHGIYVPPGDAAALRRAIDFLSTHPTEASRMGRAGRAKVEREHRLDDCMRRFAAVLGGEDTSRAGRVGT